MMRVHDRITLLLVIILFSGCVEENFIIDPGNIIELPKPRMDSQSSIEQVLKSRRSVRTFSTDPLTLEEVSQLLWAAQGTTDSLGHRTAPSAGALYPLNLYLVASNVIGLNSGIYKFLPKSQKLEIVKEEDVRHLLYTAALWQDVVKNGAISIVITGVYQRTTGKYGQRGKRYVHVETGHVAQNVYLQAVALGLGTVEIGAFDDTSVKKLLLMHPQEQPLAIIPIGKPK
jgi:SagB-type dehydrogenase family enzyme